MHSPLATSPCSLRLTARERSRVGPPAPFDAWSYGALLEWLKWQGVNLQQPFRAEVEEHTGDWIIEAATLEPLPAPPLPERPYFLGGE